MSLLDAIVDAKRESLPALAAALDARVASATGAAIAPARGTLEVAFAREDAAPLHLACEHKRRSPSGGAFDTTLALDARISAYAAAGARLVSVLTDGPYFGGSYDDVARARDVLVADGRDCLVLAKEFVIDPLQVRAARAFGADAVLLVVRLVDDPTLRALVTTARAEGLSALVEITDESELSRAEKAGATTIGVNARDLDTLVMDAARARRVLARIPRDVRAVHLSGLKDPASVTTVAEGRADAALLGEALMREPDPTLLLARLVAAARTPRAPVA